VSNVTTWTNSNPTTPTAGNVYLAATGNVGIGTIAPTAKLDIRGNIKIGTADNGVFFHGGGESIIGTSVYDILFRTSNNTDRMIIKNNGNVGI
jgi:hypothetical protein